jgi:hypothetical protein
MVRMMIAASGLGLLFATATVAQISSGTLKCQAPNPIHVIHVPDGPYHVMSSVDQLKCMATTGRRIIGRADCGCCSGVDCSDNHEPSRSFVAAAFSRGQLVPLLSRWVLCLPVLSRAMQKIHSLTTLSQHGHSLRPTDLALTPFDTNWKKGSGATPLTTQDLRKWMQFSIPTAPTKLLHSARLIVPLGNNKPLGNNCPSSPGT